MKRRALLAGAAATAALPVSAAIVQADPILALAAEWRAAVEAVRAQDAVMSALSDAMPAWVTENPRPDVTLPEFPPALFGGCGPITRASLASINAGLLAFADLRESNGIEDDALATETAAATRRLEWWNRETARRSAIHAASGVFEAEEEVNRLEAIRDEIAARIVSTPPATLAGLAALLEIAARDIRIEHTYTDDRGFAADELDFIERTIFAALAAVQRFAGR